MDCTHYAGLMSAALDGALSAGERRELDRHLADCPACAALFGELREQCAALRELDCPFPEDLHAKILNNLPEQEPAEPRRPARWRRWGALAACAVLVAGAAWAAPMLSARSGEHSPAALTDSSLPAQDADGDEGVCVGGQPEPYAEDYGAAQRSADADPEAAVEEPREKSAQPAPEPYAYTATEGNGAGAPVHYGFANDQYIRLGWCDALEEGARIVGSVQTLENLLEDLLDQMPEDDLSAVAAAYGEDYFETGRLLAIVVEEPSGSIRHKLDPQGLLWDQVTVVQTSPCGTDDLAAWLILAEVDTMFNDGDELAVTIIPYEEAEP